MRGHPSGHLVFRAILVTWKWANCGPTVGQLWVSCGSLVGQLWVNYGSSVGQTRVNYGPVVMMVALVVMMERVAVEG